MSDTSATGETVVTWIAELFAETESAAPEVTCALLVIWPALWGRTTIWTVAWAALASVPRLQVTVPAICEQLPCDGLADW